MKTLEEIKKILTEHKEEMVKKYKIKEIGIFGSFVRGEERKRSDVDMFVEFEEWNIPDLLTLIEIEIYLEKLLKKKVDLGIKSSIRREIKEQILKEAIYL